MNKILKKGTTLFTVFCLIFTMFSITGISATSDDSYEELYEKYGLKDAEKVPDGVTPIVINSPDELEAVLHSLDELNYVSFDTNEEISLFSVVTRSVSVNFHTASTLPGTKATVSLKVFYDLYSEGSFTGIQSIKHSQWALTGVTTGLELSNPYTSHSLKDGVISVFGTTSVDLYLTVSGVIKIYTSLVSAGYKYEPYKGIHDVYSQVDKG